MATLILGAAASALIGATGAAGLLATAITTAATIGGSILDSYLFGGGGVWVCGQQIRTNGC